MSKHPHAAPPRERVGLILTGGGARAAYQVGVLKALAELLPAGSPCPFPVITGTSAGAVAAAALAGRTADFRAAVAALENVWANFQVEQVFRADSRSMLRAGLHWLLAFVSSGILLPPPRSLLDNSPLRELLESTITFRGIRRSIGKHRLHALGICATGFGGGRSVTFFDGHASIPNWTQMTTSSQRVRLQLDHLMASLSIPFLFPPVMLNQEYFGDGAMRQSTPVSPAIQLGADRLLILGVRAKGYRGVAGGAPASRPPTAGQIFGFMLDTLFMDQVYADLEQLERLNHLVQHAPASFAGVRAIPALVIAPGEDLGALANAHVKEMPRPVRALLRTLGATHSSAGSLASYLMFESGYTRQLIALGHADAMKRGTELLDFITLRPPGGKPAPAAVSELLK